MSSLRLKLEYNGDLYIALVKTSQSRWVDSKNRELDLDYYTNIKSISIKDENNNLLSKNDANYDEMIEGIVDLIDTHKEELDNNQLYMLG